MPKYSFRGVRPTIIDALEHEIDKLIPNNGYVHGQVLHDRVEATSQAYMEMHPELETFKQNPQFAKMMNIAAAIHDLGKLDVANSILLKRGKLTNEEFAEIKKHPEYGAERLKNIFRNFGDFSKEEMQLYVMCKNVILQHHEKGTGRGYPNNLTADSISLEAEIMAVEDSYDAMTINRGYNNPKSLEEAKEDLKSWGLAYNQEIVDISIDLKQKELESFGKLNNKIVENPSNVQNSKIISLDDIEI